VAGVVTALALPLLLAENRKSTGERPATVAVVSRGGDLAAGLQGQAPGSGAKAAAPTTTVGTFIVSASATTGGGAPATTVAPARPKAPTNSADGLGSYTDWPAGTWTGTQRPCIVPNLYAGTSITITNLDNGHTTSCVVVDSKTLGAGIVVMLSSKVFREIADLTAAPVPVRVTW
jgi:hypothetical protein